MASLIRHGQIAADNWQLLKLADDGSLPEIPAEGDIIVPLALWQASSSELLVRNGGRLGVWLDSDEEPAQIADHLGCFEVIAVNFPQFTDGRGYSIARLLRERHGWKGELRAIGDIQRDQLFYLSRCGFDAFLLREGQAALSAFSDFTEAYQTSVERPVPLFRRRPLRPAHAAANGKSS